MQEEAKYITSVTTNKTTSTDSHEYVIQIKDELAGLDALVAVHSTALGPAHGGTRMMVYGSEAEALLDVLNLSRAMSYKSALAGLPYGGAKGVIILTKGEKYNREDLLKAYVTKINKLGGLFRTGTDVGLTDKDTTFMKDFSDYILGLPKKGNSEWSTSSAAAHGVFNAIKAALGYTENIKSLDGVTVAVKGVGKLGGHLVELLHQAGARITIADVDSKQLNPIHKKYPDVKIIDSSLVHREHVQVYSPCALGDELTNITAKELNCKFVVGGANNQLHDDSVGDLLYEHKITYVPDYVANAGGLIFVCEDLENDGFHPKRVEKRLGKIMSTVEEILELSKKLNLPTHRVADKIAQERIQSRR